jgi:hypothetical protein
MHTSYGTGTHYNPEKRYIPGRCTVLFIAWDLRRSVAWSTPSDNNRGGGGREGGKVTVCCPSPGPLSA